jgi:hypothetical protein
MRKLILATATLLAGMLGSTAHAALFSFTVDNVQQSDGSYFSFDASGTHYDSYFLMFPANAIAPFQINSGDEVLVTVNFAGSPFTIPAGNQLFGVNLETLASPTGQSSSGTMTFVNPTGGFQASLGSSCGNCIHSITGPLTSPSPISTFTSVTSDAIYFFDGSDPIDITGISISYQVTNAVPEPSTWAMLILGFAGIGLTVHRRRANDRVRTA